jgi:phosphohistidine phosphatase
MRHAKSDWGGHTADHDRPLNGRGRASAEVMGRVLSRMGQVPQLIYSSTAVRARTTAELAAGAGAWDADIELVPDLYGASPSSVLDVVGGTPRPIRCLMVVGHQPTWGDLVEALTGARVPFKTASVIGIDLAILEWGNVHSGRAELAFALSPRLFMEGKWGDLID